MNTQLKKELPYIAIFMSFVAIGFSLLANLGDQKLIQWPPEVKLEATVEVEPTPKAFENKYEEEIHRIFGEDTYRIAYAIAQSESGLQEEKCFVSTREYSCGLFQINLRAHESKVPGDTFNDKAEWLKDYKNNVLMAYFIHGSSGWWPWSDYKNGKYKKFL